MASRGKIPEYETIRRYYTELRDELNFDLEHITDSLFSKGVLNADDQDRIKSKERNGGRKAMAREFLDILMNCGEGAFDVFIETLKEVGFMEIAEILEQDKHTHPSRHPATDVPHGEHHEPEHSETMWDQEENNNINITKNYTYHVHSQNVQIGEDNKLQTTCETDGTGNMVYDVEQLKVTVAAQDQKIANLTCQLENQAGQLNEQAKQLKVYDSIFKQQPANQHRIITLTLFDMLGRKVEDIQVATDITVRDLGVKLQQQYGGRGDVIGIYNKKGEVVYNEEVYKGVRGDDDMTRTLTSLGVQEGDRVDYW